MHLPKEVLDSISDQINREWGFDDLSFKPSSIADRLSDRVRKRIEDITFGHEMRLFW